VSHWPFILGAYAFALVGTIAVTLWSWQAMRRAESEAEAVRRSK
jgi:hypothetical protein